MQHLRIVSAPVVASRARNSHLLVFGFATICAYLAALGIIGLVRAPKDAGEFVAVATLQQTGAVASDRRTSHAEVANAVEREIRSTDLSHLPLHVDTQQSLKSQLRVEAVTTDSAQGLNIFIRCPSLGVPAESVAFVNYLAEQYVERRQSSSGKNAHALRQTEARALVEARSRLDEAQRNLDDFVTASIAQAGVAPGQSAGPPRSARTQGATPRSATTQVNPAWTELQQQIQDLERARKSAAEQLTPLHPRLKLLDAELEDARVRHQGTAQFLSGAPAANDTEVPSEPDSIPVEHPNDSRIVDPRQYASLRRELDAAWSQHDRLVDADRRADHVDVAVPTITLVRAQVPAVAPPPERLTAMLAAAVGALVVGLLASTRFMRKPEVFRSVAEVEKFLPLKIAGVVK